MAEGRVRHIPSRLYPKCLGALLLFAAVLGSLLYFTGVATGGVFGYLGLAAVCIVLASIAWEIVERVDRSPGVLGWLAFPAAVALGLASLPFLVLVVYPPAEEYFSAGHVTASLRRDDVGLSLQLGFPEPTTEEGENLSFNTRPLPVDYLEEHPELFTWRGPRNLSIKVEPLLRDLELERIERVGINLRPGVPRFTYRSGRTVLPQQVVVKAPPAAGTGR